LADLYYNYATKDTNLAKYALKIAWEDNTSGEFNNDDEYVYNADTEKIDFTENTEETAGLKHMVTSEAELLFATIKPLGFNSGEALSKKFNNVTNSAHRVFVEKGENLLNKIFNKVKSKLPNFSSDQIKTIEATEYTGPENAQGTLYFDTTGNEATEWWIEQGGGPGYQAFADINLADIIKPMNTSLEHVQDMLKSAQSLVQKLQGSTITNWVEKFLNRANTLVENNAAQALQPTLLAISKDGTVNRVSGIKAAPYEAEGEVTLEPTTYTAELMAPCYAKFVGCKDITADNFNTILFSGDQELKFTPEKGKLYEIVYEAVDFFGNTFEHTYYIQGK
jgi:hypothetical protein